ncbi:n-acyl-phosphatidylethanolamine-hydrolyzing phospholipase D, mitochondrial [Trichonephila clavata]|uniref:N-acyl-phosphatidylethanolamine-hydrolyzing phospholipase D, mitochondrial n=1 Tax=Trichonephila clavata TaxID=2740835 RepID=A0A8X6J108_TRICU|nr:n-acyl-phosphatidylethanolamine-hydrolyzing phospholipase D, mitochondrial [Trichonephila clavata]
MSTKIDYKLNDVDYLLELQKTFRNIAFKRVVKTGDMYITNSINESSSNDVRIFTETQVKRSLIACFSSYMPQSVKEKLSYFCKREDQHVMYKFDDVHDLKLGENYAIQNVGHSTLLIQLPGINILTDPVFNDLNKLLYPAKTLSHPTVKQLPKIDVIIISHNHPDHIDKNSLQNIFKTFKMKEWVIPSVFVPMGDKKLLQSFGFEQVEEVEWFTKISVLKDNNTVNFISIPADHRSGRYGLDHHRSLVTGWIINPEQGNVIFKYSGDTRSLTDENQIAVDAVLWHEIKNKASKVTNGGVDIPDIICFEPSGPNYTRCDMDVTHQSTSYSALMQFIEAENLSKLSNKTTEDFIKKIKTIMMHHNKFEFGPDRFNEGLFIFKKLLLYLALNNRDLSQELLRQQEKLNLNLDREQLKKNLPYLSRPLIFSLPTQTSLLVHAKDFIINDYLTVSKKVKGLDEEQIKQYFSVYLKRNTIFPKIGERLNDEQVRNVLFDPQNVPKYNKKEKIYI